MLLRGYVQDLSDVFFINIECRFTYFEVIFLIRRRRDFRTLRTRFGIIMGCVLKLFQPVAGPTAWNSLPVQIRRANTVKKFKSALKTHLFSLHYPSED